ncbi:MAG: sigma-70 family RNA polymerase sigma factor [Eubacteriaceae bacterium]|nr:sigma-70 family RNA polymerase sigma factor [Eubacteriaceae bacterium]
MFSRDKNKQNEELIEQIICEKYNNYYRMAYSHVKNPEDAEDIVQEGAYKAIKNCNSLRNPEYASTWVYRIMMNEIFRFMGNRKVIVLGEDEIPEIPFEDTYRDLDLKYALEHMNIKDRTVIELKYFEDMKLEEIAQVLDENVNTVKSRLYRGLKKLKLEFHAEK